MSAHNPVGFRSPVTRVPPRGGVCASSSRPSALMNPRPVRAGDEAGLEPVGAPLRSGQEDQLELARRRRQQDDVVHGRHDAGDEIREALESAGEGK